MWFFCKGKDMLYYYCRYNWSYSYCSNWDSNLHLPAWEAIVLRSNLKITSSLLQAKGVKLAYIHQLILVFLYYTHPHPGHGTSVLPAPLSEACKPMPPGIENNCKPKHLQHTSRDQESEVLYTAQLFLVPLTPIRVTAAINYTRTVSFFIKNDWDPYFCFFNFACLFLRSGSLSLCGFWCHSK